MFKLRSYRWAIVSGIVALIPLGPVCGLGAKDWTDSPWIPFSIICGISSCLGFYTLFVLVEPKMRAAFAAQKARDTAVRPKSRPGRVRPFLASSTGWVILCCLLGIILCLQPVFPWAEARVSDIDGTGYSLAAAYGYESAFGIYPAVVFLAMLLLLIATGFMEPVPWWQPVVRILAGTFVLLMTSFAIALPVQQSSQSKDDSARGTIEGYLLQVKHFKLKYSVRYLGEGSKDVNVGRGEFDVDGTLTSVRMPKSAVQKPFGGVRVTARPAVYGVAALGLGLLFLGTLQLRGVLMRRRRPP